MRRPDPSDRYGGPAPAPYEKRGTLWPLSPAEHPARNDDLGPCCDDLTCSWQPIPHVHEAESVYPAPPDRLEWLAALATDEEEPHD